MQTQGTNEVFTSATDCFLKTVRKEGVPGLYKGMSSPLTFYVIQKTFQWGVYGNIRQMLGNSWSKAQNSRSHHNFPWYINFTAGAGAGIFTSFIITPMDRVKIQLQVQYPRIVDARVFKVEFWDLLRYGLQPEEPSKKYSGPIDVIKEICKTTGPRGLYRGFWATILREISGTGTYFALYEQSKLYFGQPKIWQLLLSGGITGVITWTVCFPFDVIKSRIQSHSDGMKLSEAFKKSYNEEGLRVFFKGWRPAVLRAFPVHAAVIVTYDVIIRNTRVLFYH